jgi:hypothetical protein
MSVELDKQTEALNELLLAAEQKFLDAKFSVNASVRLELEGDKNWFSWRKDGAEWCFMMEDPVTRKTTKLLLCSRKIRIEAAKNLGLLWKKTQETEAVTDKNVKNACDLAQKFIISVTKP